MNANTLKRLDVETLHMAVGPDGVPVVDTPAQAAERSSRYADEIAATVEQVGRMLHEQHEQDMRAIALLRDALGALHVELDELAHAVSDDEQGAA